MMNERFQIQFFFSSFYAYLRGIDDNVQRREIFSVVLFRFCIISSCGLVVSFIKLYFIE